MVRLILMLLLALGLALPVALAQAQDTPPITDGALIISPSRLSLATEGGCRPWADSCLQTLQVVLRSTAVITSLAMVATDLRRADALAVIPAAAITPALAKDRVRPGEVVTMTVQVSLAGIPAGEYTGDLLLVRPEGTTSLPVLVRVRDWWPIALVVLVGALLVGLWFGHYRDREQPRDDLIVQAGYLNEQINTDKELPLIYRQRLAQQIAAARTALQFGRQPEALAAVVAAQDLWRRWQSARADWIRLVAYLGQLRTALDAAPAVPHGPLRTSLVRALDTAEETLLTAERPKDVADQLATVRSGLDSFRDLSGQIAAAQTRLKNLNLATAKDHGARLDACLEELRNLTFGDAAALTTLHAAVRTTVDEVAAAVAQAEAAAPASPEGEPEGVLGAAMVEEVPTPVRPLPELGALLGQPISANARADTRAAARRLLIFNVATLIVAAVGLSRYQKVISTS